MFKSIVPKQFYAGTTLLFLVFSALSTFGQDGRTTLNELKVIGVWSKYDYDGILSGDSDYRFKFKVNSSDWIGDCISQTNQNNFWITSDEELPKYLVNNNTYIPDLSTASFGLEMEAFDNDGCGDGCDFGTGTFCVDDDGRCQGGPQYLNLKDYEPGYTHVIEYLYCASDNAYAARYQFSYDVPAPQTPTVRVDGVTSPTGNICDTNPSIQLSTNSFLNVSFLSHTYFIWQYKINNGSWNTFNQTDANVNNGQLSFSNIRSLSGLTNISVNTNVSFKVFSRYYPTSGGLYETASAETGAIHLSPVAPVINSISTQPTCFGKNTGKIFGALSGAFSEYKFVLRSGNNTTPCDPDIGNCGGDLSGHIYPWFGFFGIENVPKGTYTLVVANPGGNSGVCYAAYYPVVVDELPSLQLNTNNITAASCKDGADGAVALTSSGGTTPVTYTLSRNGGGFSGSNSNGVFTGLTAGTYVATVTDAVCQQLVTSTLTVTEPIRVTASVSAVNPSCNAPADGAVQVTILQGEGTYSYKLLRGTEVVGELNNSTLNTWTVTNLPSGSYSIEVRDAQRLLCDGFLENKMLLAPVTFQFTESDIVKTDLDCYARNNGSIQLNNVDVSGDYKYILTAQTNGNSKTLSTSSLFTNLPADNYTLSMMRNIDGCNDRFDYATALEVTQPEEVIITLNKHDISCHGETDGNIAASITGATPSDQHLWEVQLGGGWASLNKHNTFLDNLSEGTYRMRLNNNYNCSATSAEVMVIEPEVLTIASVHVSDIVCYSTPGQIETVLHGGVAPYSYAYTSPSQTIHSTTAITPINNGVYTLLAKDINGCAVSYPDPLTITTPPIPVAMSWVSSNYKGYNISCAGASNGHLQIYGWGGNGYTYSGYEYTIDSRPFQADIHIENIAAGEHTIFIRDARGCVISERMMMTEPAAQLQPELIAKHDVKCLGDADGSISLNVTGGLAPYSYTLHNIPQNTGAFSSLAPGDYTVTITDNNDCQIAYNTTITILTPPMDIQMQHTDVHCHDGADGTVQTQISGGALPINYQWNNGAINTPNLTTLHAGEYTLTVTDQQGCTQQHAVTLTEPAELAVNVTAIPVCVGKTTGEIRLETHGGTPGYQYAINDGTIYQDSPLFIVAAGTFAVRTRDINGCEASASANVITRNDQPEPNFIVATTQQASDTLMVKEISVPKPDSIQWTFDPAITLLNDDVWSPLITINDPGSYDITLRGFFGGCDYANTLTLTINPFDPELKVGKNIPSKVIKSLTATPNTSNGQFEVAVELNTKQRLSVAVYDMLGIVHYRQGWDKTSGIKTTIDISETAASGLYIVQAVTDTDATEIRLVVIK